MKLYPECRFVLCYEGEGEGEDPSSNNNDGGGDGGDGDSRVFTQEQVNKILAEDKRKHQSKFEKLEQNLNALNESQNLTEQEKEKIAREAEDLRKELRTKETQAEVERKKAEAKYKNELEEYKSKAEKWEGMFRQSTVQRNLQDAAVQGDAYEPEQIMTILQPFTELKEDDGGRFKVMVNFQDVDEKTGDPIETLRTPLDAVNRMKELKKYKNLFNSGVVSGIGGDNITGKEGDIDVSQLTQEQYRKIRAENPERLGLPPNRRSRK